MSIQSSDIDNHDDSTTGTNEPINTPNNDTIKYLVDPVTLAYRLCYLLNAQQKGNPNSKKRDFFRITKKMLEALAEYKVIDASQQNTSTQQKAPISEAYIACTIYELELINCCLVKIDREYLVAFQADIKKLMKLTPDTNTMNTLLTLTRESLQQEIQASLNKESSDDKPLLIEKRIIEEGDEQQVLLGIWKELLTHVKLFIDTSATSSLPSSSERIKPLTYKSLCALLPYQLHQNGLASYLYSIMKYCKEKKLPRLDYLVVKEGTGFPDGVLATDIEAIKDFHDQLEQVVTFVKESDNSFPSEPCDLKFEKKPRAKKASRKQVTFTPLTGE